MTKTVLITGASGFLGRNTARKFKKNGFYIYACGHGSWLKNETIEWGIDEWLEGDINMNLLKQFNVQPDVIVHCAGSGSVGLSLEDPSADFHKTVSSTLSVLDFIRLYSPDTKLIYPSSAAVYGEHTDTPIYTHDILKPASPYGVHKKISEELCLSYHDFFDVSSIVIRFFSIYGPGLKKQLLWDACHKLNNVSNDVMFWGTGNETRDWIYISDATELIYLSALSSNDFFIINGGTGEKNTIKRTLSILSKQLSREELSFRFNNIVRTGDPRFYQADIHEVDQLNWTAKIDLKEGLKKYANWYKGIIND